MRGLLLCFVVIISASSSYAQVNYDSLVQAQVDQVVITAQFGPTDAKSTVNSVRLINRTTIEQRAAVSLAELLQTEANLRISQDAVLGSGLSVNGLRGENVKILLDGVPIVGRQNGNIDMGQIPLNSIQKIEIIEGAQSLLYGSDASGGVINLITIKSQLSSYNAEANINYETNGFKNASTQLGFTNGNFTGLLSGGYQNFRPNIDTTFGRDQLWNPKEQYSGRAMLRYKSSKNAEYRISAGAVMEEVINLGDILRPIFKPYSFDEYYKTNRYDASFFTERQYNQNWTSQLTFGWNGFYRIKNAYRRDIEKAENMLIEGQQDTSSAQGYLLRFTLASNNNDRKINYLFGLENMTETASGLRIRPTDGDQNTFAYTNDLGVFGSVKANLSSNLILQTGARFTHNNRYGSNLTPSTWAMWTPINRLKIKASWAYGFRSPSIKELYFDFIDVNHFVIGNEDLTAERSMNLRTEVIIDAYEKASRSVQFTLTGFYNKIRDRIILAEFERLKFQYRNLDQWETQGLSFRINTQWNDRLRLQSDVVATGFYNEQYDGKTKKFLLSTDWANEVNYELIKTKLSINVWQKITGATPYFFQSSVDGSISQGMAEGWNMMNAGLSYRHHKSGIKINSGFKNILNVRQVRTGATGTAEMPHTGSSSSQSPHWGRTFYFNIIYAFSK